MKYLLAICIFQLNCLQFASADDSIPAQASMIARCTLEGIGKGHRGKDLEDFVARCVKAGQSGGEDDPVIRAALSAC